MMGPWSGNDPCEYPGCTSGGDGEPRYVINPDPPPMVMSFSLCSEHVKLIPTDWEERMRMAEMVVQHRILRGEQESGEQAQNGGRTNGVSNGTANGFHGAEPAPGREMDRVETVPMPEPWPPEDWPHCPSRERYREAVERLERMARGAGGHVPLMDEPSAMTPQVRDTQIILHERMNQVMVELRVQRLQQRGAHLDLDSEFNFTMMRTGPHGIGILIVRENPGRMSIDTYQGLIPRDTEWTGCSPALTRVEGLEALVLCRGRMHDPDAVLAIPRRALLKDPGEKPACFQGRRLMGRTGHAPALAEVLRHHGSNPHFLDFCPEVNPQNRALDDLVGKIG